MSLIIFVLLWISLPKTPLMIHFVHFLNSAFETDMMYSDRGFDELDCRDLAMVSCC